MRVLATCSVLGPHITDSSLNVLGRLMMGMVISGTWLSFPLEIGLPKTVHEESWRWSYGPCDQTDLHYKVLVSFWSHLSLQILDIILFLCNLQENWKHQRESSRRKIQSDNLDLLRYNCKLIVVDVQKQHVVSYASLSQEAMTSGHLWYLSISASLLPPMGCIFYCLNP